MSKYIGAWAAGLLFFCVSGAFGTEEPTFTREAVMAIAAVFQERAGAQRLPDAALLLDLQHLIAREMNLPDNAETPGVAVASEPMMMGMRFRDVPGDRGAELAAASAQPEIVAIYDDEDRTIYLPDGWNGRSAAEQSIVIHELVHHLQNLAGVRYGCPEEREGAAYEAQERWLRLFGTNLETEFGVDPFTLLVRTHCPY